jgi:hypothetical protein
MKSVRTGAELSVPDFMRKTEIRNQLNIYNPNEDVQNKTRIYVNPFEELFKICSQRLSYIAKWKDTET